MKLSNNLLTHLGLSEKELEKLKKDGKIKEEMSIADIYHLKDEVGQIEKNNKESKFGFN
jgi:hypothetical protein